MKIRPMKPITLVNRVESATIRICFHARPNSVTSGTFISSPARFIELEDRALAHPQPDIDSDQDQDDADQERYSPPKRFELVRAQECVGGEEDQVRKHETGGNAELRKTAVQAAAAIRRVLDRHGDGAPDFAADRKTL